MTQTVLATSDYKIGKDGRKYPARRIHLGTKEKIQEASYRGNIGVMELVQFHSKANEKDKLHFNSLMKKKAEAKTDSDHKKIADQIWSHVQKVTGTRLHQMENTELLSFKQLVESKEDFILQSLADKDINASIKDGKVVIHDHSQHSKAKAMVKRMGMPHQVVKSVKEDYDNESSIQEELSPSEFLQAVNKHKLKQAASTGHVVHYVNDKGHHKAAWNRRTQKGIVDINHTGSGMDLIDKVTKNESVDTETSDSTVAEATTTREFNQLVRGYLAHKKASKKGGFRALNFHQYAATAKKAQSVKEDKTDTVTMDVPLLTRVLEMAREDIKSDEELHVVVTKLIEMAKNGTLSMENYKKLTEDKKLVVPTLKPRDPNHLILAAKKVAAGKHKNAKRELAMGKSKHKNKSIEE